MPKSLKLTEPFIHILKERKVKHSLVSANSAAHKAHLDAGEGVIMIEKYRGRCAKKVTESKGR